MTSARKRATANRLTSASRCKAVAGQRMRMTALFIRMIRTGAAPNWNAERRLAVAAEEERAAQLGRSRRALGRRQAAAQKGIGAAGLARRERIGHEQDGPQEAACPRYSQIARGN